MAVCSPACWMCGNVKKGAFHLVLGPSSTTFCPELHCMPATPAFLSQLLATSACVFQLVCHDASFSSVIYDKCYST